MAAVRRNNSQTNAIQSSPNRDAKQSFLFDIIVTSLETPNDRFDDPMKLTVDTRFNAMPIRMTSSRINVGEFVNQRHIEFVMDPERLRKSVQEHDMNFSVSYSGRTVGTGKITFPTTFTDRIEQGMSDAIYDGSCDLERNKKFSGKLKFKCRLIIKCNEEDVGEDACPRDIGKSINPNDIFFVLGQPQECAIPDEPCPQALESEEGDVMLNLDLERYRSAPNARVEDIDMMVDRPLFSAACYDLKNIAAEYGQIIDSVNKAAGDLANAKPPCYAQHDIPKKESMPRKSYWPSSVLLDDQPVETYKQKTIPENIKDYNLNLAELNPIRFCPVCLANMSWLPKYAACMKCGIKPVPVDDKERLKERKLTADEILAEYFDKPKVEYDEQCLSPCEKALKNKIEGSSQEDCPPCRCKCQSNKVCAHCRVRKACADIFPPQGIKTCPKVEPKEDEDFCIVSGSSEDCRPYLARVFSELRILYDINDNKNDPGYEGTCGQSRKSASKANDKARTPGGQDIQQAPFEGTRINSERHKHCIHQRGPVAHNHGWAWPKSFEARKHGWRPGVVRKPIKKLMRFFLESESKFDEDICKEAPEPVLQVCKKEGEIFITLRPLSTLGVEQNPITFRVVKSDLAVALSEIKSKLKEKGFRKCTCNQTVMMCRCRTIIEKKELEYAIKRECRKRGMPTCADHLILTDTSESEMEYDFEVTPPAGTRPPSLRPRQRTAQSGTQTSKKDRLPIKPKYPIEMSPYYRPYDCAAGDHYKAKAKAKPRKGILKRGV